MKSQKLNLCIYNYIKQHNKLPKHEPSEKSKYAYHCRKLVLEGKIRKLGYGVWEVQQVQKRQKGTSETLIVRSHGYHFQLLLPKIRNWDKRTDYLKHKRIAYKSINGGQMLKCRRHNVYLYDTHIDIGFLRNKSISSDDPEANNDRAIIEFKLTAQALSNKLKTDFKVDNQFIFRCHHAQIRNKIAKYHLDRGIKKFSIKDEFGVEWLLMDNSFNLMELETVNPETATEDMKNIILPFMTTLKKNPKILGETVENLGFLTESLQQVAKNQVQYTKNATDSQKQINELTKIVSAQSQLTSVLVNEVTKLTTYINTKL